MKEKTADEIISEIEEARERLEKRIKDIWFSTTYSQEQEEKDLKILLSDYKRVLKENEELKEYIAIEPNLDEMTATKYRNIQQDAYIQGRAEEQQKAEQIIYENYIPVQKVKDKIEELKQEKKKYGNCLIEMYEDELVNRDIKILQELIEESEKK